MAPLTDTFTSMPESPSSLPLSEELEDEDCEPLLDDEAVLGLPELEELLDDELLELGIDGIEDDEEEELGIDGAEEEDEEELGIEGGDGIEEDDEGDELGIDGIEDELLELCWVVSQPASTRPRVTAAARALSEGNGLLMLRSSTVAS